MADRVHALRGNREQVSAPEPRKPAGSRSSTRGSNSSRLAATGSSHSAILVQRKRGGGHNFAQIPLFPVERSGVGRPAEEHEGALAERIRRSIGRGLPLEPHLQRTVEGGLGTDLSRVRVHADREADNLARSVDAVAFTTGSDIFFRHGAFNPHTPQGLHLLTYEAIHTVQQALGPVAGTPLPGGIALSNPDDRFERAAQIVAPQLTVLALQGLLRPRRGKPLQPHQPHGALVPVQRIITIETPKGERRMAQK